MYLRDMVLALCSAIGRIDMIHLRSTLWVNLVGECDSVPVLKFIDSAPESDLQSVSCGGSPNPVNDLFANVTELAEADERLIMRRRRISRIPRPDWERHELDGVAVHHKAVLQARALWVHIP